MLSNMLRNIAFVAGLIALFSGSADRAAAASRDIPAWLQQHVGTGAKQIAPIVLARARALYQRKVREGVVSNSCYFAKDATRPHSPSGGRFYVICESRKSFRTVSSGHGNGRNLQRASFRNGRECAKHFSNTEGSNLTAGGSYLTAEIRKSFKGYFEQSGAAVPFVRDFLIFDGEGETSNSRYWDIGGHQAVFLRSQCRFLNPSSAYADDEGYVPFGKLVNYTGGRSNGCTTWSPAQSREIIALVRDNPTTLYLYPESKDIAAVAEAVLSDASPVDAGAYWNAACLKEIGLPKFWPKDVLQPIVNAWRQSLPKGSAKPLPICK